MTGHWAISTLLSLVIALAANFSAGQQSSIKNSGGEESAAENYYVVVGSFLDSATAIKELARRSDRSGNTLRIAISEVQNQTWHRLISGPFVSSVTASSEQTSWQQVGVDDAWIIRLDIPQRRKKPLRLALSE
jgi:cell division protein FtsN